MGSRYCAASYIYIESSLFMPAPFFSSHKYWFSFFKTCLPPSLQDVQIVSTDENQVFLALQEWYQSDTYNLYQSDPQGVYYSIVLENVRSTKQPEENVLIDILEVKRGGAAQEGNSLWAWEHSCRPFSHEDTFKVISRSSVRCTRGVASSNKGTI